MKIPIHCSHTRKANPDDLRPHPRNPNRHTDQQIAMLAHIIEGNGWRNPIVVSKRTGLIIKGHARHAAAVLLNAKEVPVDDQDYKSEADELADLVADNRMAELAELDYASVRAIFADTDLFPADFDLDLTGFDLFSRADIKKKYGDEPEESTNGEVVAAHVEETGDTESPEVIGGVQQTATADTTDGAPEQQPAAPVKCPKCGFQLS